MQLRFTDAFMHGGDQIVDCFPAYPTPSMIASLHRTHEEHAGLVFLPVDKQWFFAPVVR
jgi:hypothetical protein